MPPDDDDSFLDSLKPAAAPRPAAPPPVDDDDSFLDSLRPAGAPPAAGVQLPATPRPQQLAPQADLKAASLALTGGMRKPQPVAAPPKQDRVGGMIKEFGQALPGAMADAAIGQPGRQLASMARHVGEGEYGAAAKEALPLAALPFPAGRAAIGMMSYPGAAMRGLSPESPRAGAQGFVEAAGALGMAGEGGVSTAAAPIKPMAPAAPAGQPGLAGRVIGTAKEAAIGGLSATPVIGPIARGAWGRGKAYWDKTTPTGPGEPIRTPAAAQPMPVPAAGAKNPAARPNPLEIAEAARQIQPPRGGMPAELPTSPLDVARAEASVARPLANIKSAVRFKPTPEVVPPAPQPQFGGQPPERPVSALDASLTEFDSALASLEAAQVPAAAPPQALPLDVVNAVQAGAAPTPREVIAGAQPPPGPANPWKPYAERTGTNPPSLSNMKRGRAHQYFGDRTGPPVSFHPGNVPGGPPAPAVRISSQDLPRLPNGEIDWAAAFQGQKPQGVK